MKNWVYGKLILRLAVYSYYYNEYMGREYILLQTNPDLINDTTLALEDFRFYIQPPMAESTNDSGMWYRKVNKSKLAQN